MRTLVLRVQLQAYWLRLVFQAGALVQAPAMGLMCVYVLCVLFAVVIITAILVDVVCEPCALLISKIRFSVRYANANFTRIT